MAVQRKRGLRFTWVRGVAVASDALGFGKLGGVQQTYSYLVALNIRGQRCDQPKGWGQLTQRDYR